MNQDLQDLFIEYYRPSLAEPMHMRGSSSVDGTGKLRYQLQKLFYKHKIGSIFDAGCNDCSWVSLLDINYQGGDISPDMIALAKELRPYLDVRVFDLTTDDLPTVDALFVRDVAIHLSTQDKQRMIDNWRSSNIPWILMTHMPDVAKNDDVVYNGNLFPYGDINWCLHPWLWPAPVDQAWEIDEGGRCMALWHREQIWPTTPNPEVSSTTHQSR